MNVHCLTLLSAAFDWAAQCNGFVGQGLKLAQTVSGSVVEKTDRTYCLSMKIFDWKRRQDDSYRLGMDISSTVVGGFGLICDWTDVLKFFSGATVHWSNLYLFIFSKKSSEVKLA